MPAYMIFIREDAVVDAEAMAGYQNRNRSAPPPPGMKPLVVYGALEAFEGKAPDGVVIIEFSDMDAAKAWYFSEEYQEATKLRQQGAPSFRAMLVDGWKP